MKRIAVLDLGTGNLASVKNAFHYLGYEAYIHNVIERPLESATHVVMPGVGSFSSAIQSINDSKAREYLLSYCETGRPLLGICLGMQLLATIGTEGGENEGLALLKGRVRRVRITSKERLPHIGWNEVSFSRPHPVFRGLKSCTDYYFVHSYCFAADDNSNVLATTQYGEIFAAAVGLANVVGVQFHPEKSNKNGLKILENFAEWDGITC